MSDYQEHITALRVLIVSGAVRGRTVEYSGDEALAMTDHLNAIETALAAERAKVAKLVEALKPFAEYMADGGDRNAKGEPLPDTEGVGWVYLTVGDFRRARAAITEAGQ